MQSTQQIDRARASPEAVLQAAFGLIDEFVRDIWESAMRESYRLYSNLSRGHSNIAVRLPNER